MGLMHISDYLTPTSLEETLALLKERGEQARLLGGGIELVRYSPSQVSSLIDLSALHLSTVREAAGGLAIGAMSTLREIQEFPAVAGYHGGVIQKMLRQVASPLLRNLATVGGALVSANPWSDVITLFLVLDAQVTLYDGKDHTIPLSELYPTGRRLQNAILTEVVLPAAPRDSAAAFCKFSRTGFDVAVLNCACFVQLDDGCCALARIVAGGTPRLAARLPQAEEALIGEELTEPTIDQVARAASDSADVREDRRASAEYRKQLAYVGVKRCLQEIKDRLTEAQ